MTDEEINRAARRAAFLGISSDHYDRVVMPKLQATGGNAEAVRDEAVREYDYMHRTLEALDAKGAAGLAASLALLTLAVSLDGRIGIRVAVGVTAVLAGLFCGTMLTPDKVRGLRSGRLIRKYATRPTRQFLLQVAAQYVDATEATRLPAKVKVLRLRYALFLLFLSAVLLAFR